jgi:hypothetical protein
MFGWFKKKEAEPDWVYIGTIFGYSRKDEKHPHITTIPLYTCYYDYDSLTFKMITGKCTISGTFREDEKVDLDTFVRYMFIYDATIGDYLDTHPHNQIVGPK